MHLPVSSRIVRVSQRLGGFRFGPSERIVSRLAPDLVRNLEQEHRQFV
ncbi:hypothetical protein [Cupriavidus basilensis]|nr:hypothetical protein [Cupriavidus basilensis]MDR3382555.1 hypothetical protein [Cupriavidus basilensis]